MNLSVFGEVCSFTMNDNLDQSKKSLKFSPEPAVVSILANVAPEPVALIVKVSVLGV